MSGEEKLPVRVKLGYGVGEFASSLFWITIAFYLMNFMTDEVGISASLAGLALMVGKIWDAVTDPAVGFISDRTKTRWGRRRPWFLFSALPFGILFLVMFTNPQFNDQIPSFLWMTFAFILLCSAYTCANVPYNSLLPELSKDFHERSSLSAFKSIFAVTATIFGAVLALPITNAFGGHTNGYMALGAIFGGLITVSVLIPFFTVKEPPAAHIEKAHNIFKSNLLALKNRPFRLILLTWFFNTGGFVLLSGTLVYFFKYIYLDKDLSSPASGIMLITSMLFIPLVLVLSKKIGKRMTYILGMSLFTVVVLMIFLFGHVWGIASIYIMMLFAGVGLSTHFVMPWAIIPDTVEYDYSITGARREGVYYGLWTFISKIGNAVAVLLLGVVLDLAGYIPDIPQTETALLGIRLLIGPFSALFFILGIIFLAFYSIDKKQYGEIQERIKRMETGG
jgi:GPH family glycoside/pentoside/hexuronide:cation symporter